MPCDVIDIPGGYAIVRRSRRPLCQFCKVREHTKLCDFKVKVGDVGHTRTCDAKMCDQCAFSMGADVDFCPPHAAKPIFPEGAPDA